MLGMGKRRWLSRLGVQLTLLIVAFAAGCSRPVGLQGTPDSHHPEPQGVPFHTDTGVAANSHAGTQQSDTQDESDTTSASGVPFKSSSSRLLPAGTLLTVRLESPLSSARLEMGRTFIAAVDEPVIIGANTIVSRDARVQGRVESARVSGVRRNAGYVRLTLESIRIEGKDVPVQTSSLFARGTRGDVHTGDWTADPSRMAQSTIIRLKKGRRLTFRLTEPLDLGKGTGVEPVAKRPPVNPKTQPTTE